MKPILTSTLTLFCLLPTAFAADHGHDHGPETALGETAIGAAKLSAVLGGEAKPGTEVHLELRLTPAQPAPTAIRAWIGVESGKGSAKAKAGGDATKGTYESHLVVPAQLAADGRVWIAVEQTDGTTSKVSFAIPPADPKSGGHGHSH